MKLPPPLNRPSARACAHETFWVSKHPEESFKTIKSRASPYNYNIISLSSENDNSNDNNFYGDDIDNNNFL